MSRKAPAKLLEFSFGATLKADLGLRPQVGYVRKSSESEDKQVRSNAQQREQIEAHAGRMTHDLWFEDDASGRSFDRPAFQRLLAFCRANPQPKQDPGKVWFFDVSRFGRIVDATSGQPDVDATEYQRLQLKELGWLVSFVHGPNTGTPLIDGVLRVVQMEASSQYTTDLSRKVAYGKADAAKGTDGSGWWIGGVAPYGTSRFNSATKKVLQETRYDPTEGKILGDHGHQRATVLVRNEAEAGHLEWAMREFLKGSSLNDVCRRLNKRTPTRLGNPWLPKSLLNAFTNRALVGEMTHQLKDGPLTIKKRWDALIDAELFWKVQDELARRRSTRGAYTRRGEYALSNLFCSRCGAPLFGASEVYEGKTYSYYRHQFGTKQLSAEQQARAEAAGCNSGRVPAERLEDAIRDLLRRQRGTAEYAKHLRVLFEARASAQGQAQREVDELEEAVSKLRGKVQRMLLRAEEEEDRETAEELFGRWKILKEELRTAEKRAEQARIAARSELNLWEGVEARLDESEDLLAAWDGLGAEERRAIVDWWVIAIFVELPRTRKLRDRQIKLRVYLHAFPQTPEVVTLQGGKKPSGPPDDLGGTCNPSRWLTQTHGNQWQLVEVTVSVFVRRPARSG